MTPSMRISPVAKTTHDSALDVQDAVRGDPHVAHVTRPLITVSWTVCDSFTITE